MPFGDKPKVTCQRYTRRKMRQLINRINVKMTLRTAWRDVRRKDFLLKKKIDGFMMVRYATVECAILCRSLDIPYILPHLSWNINKLVPQLLTRNCSETSQPSPETYIFDTCQQTAVQLYIFWLDILHQREYHFLKITDWNAYSSTQ